MDILGHFLVEGGIDEAVALDPTFSAKGGGNDFDLKMGLAALSGAGMAFVLVGFINDINPQRVKRGAQFGANLTSNTHRELAEMTRINLAIGARRCQAAFSRFVQEMQACAAALVRDPGAPHTVMMRRLSLENSAKTAPQPQVRPCDHRGCAAKGDFRAPRSRADLQVFYWFCLEHVRAYNAAWNYYAGMSEAEIEAELRNDTVWQRPSWPLGSRIAAGFAVRMQDYGLFDLDEAAAGPREVACKRPLTPQEEALAIFELNPPITVSGLKARYKELVKRHHPDSHGGDKVAEEKLKVINKAYSTLKASYFPGA